jgi:DNA-binding NarL/FixJ family response regulator
MSETGVAVCSVVVVDDHVVLRAGTRQILEQSEKLHVIGEAGTVREAIDVVGSVQPDVVLMDIRLPDGNGLEAARQVVAKNHDVKIVVLSAYDDDDYIQSALSLGVSGFLLKTVKSEELINAVLSAADGMVVLDPSILKRLRKDEESRQTDHHGDSTGETSVTNAYAANTYVTNIVGSPSVAMPDDQSGQYGHKNFLGRDAEEPGEGRMDEFGRESSGLLSDREISVIKLVGMGLPNKSIASQLYISVRTVEGHLGRIFTKLGLHSRAELMRYAYSSGMVATEAKSQDDTSL